MTNWTGAPGPEPLGIRAAMRNPVQRYRRPWRIATSSIDYRHLPFGGGGAIWTPGEMWRRMPEPDPPHLAAAVRAFYDRHHNRPRPLHPKYRD